MAGPDPTRTLPHRPPDVGELVQVRSRRWLVEEVQPPAHRGGASLVTLACATDDAQGESLQVFWDYELDRRILAEEDWSGLARRGFDDPRKFAAFLHTLRWHCVTAEPSWFPAVENRGEGVFLRLRTEAVDDWLGRAAVKRRLDALERGHARWAERRKSARGFPGGPYVLLHTLSHLLIQSLAMQCGYPASSLRERVYAEDGRYGLLVYTGSPDAEGTLGGLVQQARHLEDHIVRALEAGELCSNDPTCAEHAPGESMEARWLHGAACHGCALVAETSCEMRNDYLDRALVVPVLGEPDAAFFGRSA